MRDAPFHGLYVPGAVTVTKKSEAIDDSWKALRSGRMKEMVLYVGGIAQGMEEAAAQRFGEGERVRRLLYPEEQIRKEMQEADFTMDDIPELAGEWLSRIMSEEEEGMTLVVLSREVGCGVVPMEEREELFRELAGRLQVELAKKANEVYRVWCGIEERIR